MEKFFLSCPIHLEEIAASELTQIWPWLIASDGRPHSEEMKDLALEKGGISFSAPFELGIQLNYWHRSSLRLLWRLSEFRCRDFPKLFNSLKKIDIAAVLGAKLSDFNVELHVSCSSSRLNHEGRVTDTCEKAWSLTKKSSGQPLNIFVRIHDDNVTVSLDTTGEHLHFRHAGVQAIEITTAPLRENLASSILQQLSENTSWSELHDITLVDPMMGSGTILSEALLWNQPLSREFSFQKWKRTPKIFRSSPEPRQASLFKGYVGCDIDEKAVALARKRLNSARVDFSCADLFSSSPVAQMGKNWLISNPPYGERLETNFTPKQMVQASIDKFHPEKIGILFSERQAREAKSLSFDAYTSRKPLKFSNGGIAVEFMMWDLR